MGPSLPWGPPPIFLIPKTWFYGRVLFLETLFCYLISKTFLIRVQGSSQWLDTCTWNWRTLCPTSCGIISDAHSLTTKLLHGPNPTCLHARMTCSFIVKLHCQSSGPYLKYSEAGHFLIASVLDTASASGDNHLLVVLLSCLLSVTDPVLMTKVAFLSLPTHLALNDWRMSTFCKCPR